MGALLLPDEAIKEDVITCNISEKSEKVTFVFERISESKSSVTDGDKSRQVQRGPHSERRVICLHNEPSGLDMMHHRPVRARGNALYREHFEIAATLSAYIYRDRYGPALIALAFIE